MAVSKGYMAKIGLDTSDADKKIRSLNSELKTIDKSIKENGDSVLYTQQKYAAISEEISQYQKKLVQLTDAQQRMNDALSDGVITDADYRAYEREVDRCTQAIKRLTDEQKALGNSSQDAAEGLNVFGQMLAANLASGAIGLEVEGIKKLGEATVGLVKDATAAYGEYQQLAGGVETLFSGAEDIVAKNASEAFANAGISANQYMQQITSFAAAMVNSLGGDTKEAAKLADQAIIDMSDNANKMGTDLASIQNAYQGFAKQNYTMLDNLKLGYGGTKTEMERLIADANEFREASGRAGDLTIEKYSDVVSAIHEVQTQLGITGTTAAEAADTIQGAAGAAQAAWENLVAGLADPAADLDRLINDFILSKTTEIENMLPTIEHSIEGITQAIDTIMPKLTESGGIDDELIDDISKQAPTLIVHLAENVLKGLPALANAALTIAENLVTSIANEMPELVPSLVKVISELITTIISHTDDLAAAGIELIKGLNKAIISALPELAVAAVEILSSLVEGISNVITEAIPRISEIGADFCQYMADGLSNYDWGDAAERAVKALQSALDAVMGERFGYDTEDEIQKKQDEADARLAEAQAKLEETKREAVQTAYEAQKAEQAAEGSQKRAATYMEYLQTQSTDRQIKTTEQLEAELKAKEEMWDRLYHYDKKSQEEYWTERREYLDTHRSNTEAWWNAWNETEKHFADKAAKEQKDAEDARAKAQKASEEAAKKAADAQKKSIEDAFKELEIQSADEGKGKEWLLKQQRAYIDTLDKSSELYRTYDQKWRKDWADWQKKQRDEEEKQRQAAEKQAQKDTDNWVKYAEKRADAQQKAVEKIEQAERNTADAYNRQMQDFTRMTDANGEERLIIADVKEKIKELETYEKNIEKLKGMGLPDGMLDDILSMNFDERALYVKELLRMSERQRSNYFGDYAKYRETAQRVAHTQYEDDYAQAAKDAADATADIWSQMPDTATEEGRKAAKAYIDAYTGYMRENGYITDAAVSASNAVGMTYSAKAAANQTIGGNLTINVAGKLAIATTLKEIFASMKNSGAVIDV